jgi:microcystin-dependent protein
MANYEATKYDFNGGNIQGLVGVSTGSVIPWGATSIPTGFLECDGSAVSRSTYATLFGVIGTTYGTGDGSSTFNLPNIADNIVVGKSGTKNVGSTGGANTVASSGTLAGSTGNTTLSVSQIPDHNHTSPGARTTAGASASTTGATSPRHPQSTSNTNATNAGGNAHSHNVAGATFTGGATSVLQPYLTVIYIIKT